MKKEKAITLIALIITIIIMLILAGIVLSLAIGENGIFKTAKYAVQKNSEETAKEKLELALADLTSHKYTNEDYNENGYIDNYLENEDMTVIGNVVTVDNWNFEIDRSIPAIKSSLGESEVKITKEVKGYLGKNENDKYMVSVLIKIESNIKIESIEFENTDGTILTVTTEKETLSKDMQIELDREYKITVKMANGKIENRTITERSVENIKTAEELAKFRDKVNSGLTYEGKTINLLNDIDLSNICGANVNGQNISWIPINSFKGIFDGHDNSIKNIYINTAQGNNGLFNSNGGTIQNINISGTMITTSQYGNHTAGVAVSNSGTISNCINNVTITSSGPTGGIVGINSGIIVQCANIAPIYAVSGNNGGITGVNMGLIKECYNTGTISATADVCTGGITGTGADSIYNCYNRGNVSGKSAVGGITGVVNGTYKPGGVKYTYNSYNTGYISGASYVGQITGRENFECTSQNVNCYTTNAVASNLNAGAYSDNVWIDDGKKIDKNGNIVDNLDEHGNIKYINDGYPILKWQVQE